MSKKVKCIECAECMRFFMPNTINKDNIDYVNGVLNLAGNKIVCGRTNKSKMEDHEQYCKYFAEAEDRHKKINTEIYNKELAELKEKLRKYEQELL